MNLTRLTKCQRPVCDNWLSETRKDVVQTRETRFHGRLHWLTPAMTPHVDFSCPGHRCRYIGVVGGGYIYEPDEKYVKMQRVRYG